MFSLQEPIQPPEPVKDDFYEILDPDPKNEVCGFCARQIKRKEQGRLEIHWSYQQKEDKVRGYFICIRCKNDHDNWIQEKVERTWMKIKARSERPCCGGSQIESNE